MGGLLPFVLLMLAGAPPPAQHAASACGSCHGVTLTDWRASAHADAWTSPLFRAGLQVEPKAFCVGCHAPETARADEGIGCVTCHEANRDDSPAVRRMPIAPARPDAGAEHAVALRSRAALADPAFCRSCHEFATPAFEGGRKRGTALPMQSTYSEWLAYQRAGDAETCQSCHMPGGRHVMSGTRDLALLRGALAVTARDEPTGATLTLASVGVGHDFPTGDLFRHLTVEVRPLRNGDADRENSAWRIVDRIGRTFATRLDDATLLAHKEETANTSLVPGASRVVALPPREGPLGWRVRYHYGSERDEQRGLVPAAALVTTLAEGRLVRATEDRREKVQ